jgi:hypothetical protein
MDAERFHAFVRSIELRASRRAALALLGAGLSALSSPVGVRNVEARKRKRRRNRHRKGNTPSCQSGTRMCGAVCIPATSCCVDADCGGESSACDNGSCVCLAPGDVPCPTTACCSDEVCASFEGDSHCQRGGCPTTDWCTDPNIFQCQADCYCVTSIDQVNVCIDVVASSCAECASDAECTAMLGVDAVCLPNGGACGYLCDPALTAFCMAVTCSGNGSLRIAGVPEGSGKHNRRLKH